MTESEQDTFAQFDCKQSIKVGNKYRGDRMALECIVCNNKKYSSKMNK